MSDNASEIDGLREFQRIIMENNAMWLNALDSEAKVTMWNRAAERISGYSSEEVIGRSDIWELLYPDEAYRGSVFTRAMEIIEQGKRVENFETTIQRKDGGKRILSWNSHNLTDTQGAVIGSLALARDVTDIRNSEAQLAQALERAEAGSRAKDQFIAATSHEIRTPITAILGMLDMLQKTQTSGEQQEYLGVARTATNILLTTIDDILDVARLTSGSYALHPGPADPTATLANSAKVLANEARNKGLRFSYTLDSELPESIVVDHERLQQIIINLGYNALKFTDSGEITLSAELAGSETERLRITLTDTGIGIPEDRLKDILKPYEQADNSVARRYGGLGLGLSIVSQLLRMMGGEIAIKSKVAEGTTVTVELPFAPSQAPGLGQGVKERSDAGKAGARPLRILLAEDNELNVYVIQSFLKGLPHHVDVAVNGSEAVRLYDDGSYDLILMDIQMPEMDGYTAMREIRKRESLKQSGPCYIAALTAHATASEREQALEGGFNEYITKPIAIERLHGLLGRIAGTAAGPVN